MKLKAKDYQNLQFDSKAEAVLANKMAKLIAYADQSRQRGILVLEAEAMREEDLFISHHLRDMCDSTEPKKLIKKMRTWTRADNLSGINRIIRAIEIQALKDIQSGENPRRMANHLIAYVPPKARAAVEHKLADLLEPDTKSTRLEFNALYSSEKPTALVKETIRRYLITHHHYRQVALEASDRQVIAGLLYRAPRRFQNSVSARLPLMRLDSIFDYMERMGAVRLEAMQPGCHEIFRFELELLSSHKAKTKDA
jgi:hypothetical protein